jgi:hypothetical protein
MNSKVVLFGVLLIFSTSVFAGGPPGRPPHPIGSGDVSGPGSTTDNNVTCFDGTGGKTVKECPNTGAVNLYLVDGNGAAPTSDGLAKYDRTTEILQVGDGATTKSFIPTGSTSAFQITGNLSGKVGVITKSAGYTLGTDSANEAYGYLLTMTATGTVVLPAVAIGMSVCVYSTTAAAVHIDPNASDKIILDGTALDDGDKVSSASGAGDFICLVGHSADGWLTMGRSGTWTDGG